MFQLYQVPSWFKGYDISLEILFAICCFLIAYYSLRIYRIAKQREPFLLGISFALFCMAYIMQAVMNVFPHVYSNNWIMSDMFLMLLIGLFLAGLLSLAFMFSHSNSSGLYIVMYLSIGIGIFMSILPLMTFYIISSLFILYFVISCIFSYMKTKKENLLFTTVAFFLMLVGKVLGTFTFSHALSYAAYHALTFLAFVIFIINLLLVLRYEKKA
ncbi:MAG TPA: hypothetical protein VK158_03440 [Acidobacteriota bacterium]|nr:hypothetical protein [Acidobacteriota bacterium]